VKALMSDYLPFELEGKRFLLMHLHYLNDKDIPESNEYTIKFTKDLEEKYKPDYIISGHTHVAKIAMHGDIPVINPGSLNKPRYPQTSGSYIVATLDNGELTYQIKYL
jgi:putative phosphoesterase